MRSTKTRFVDLTNTPVGLVCALAFAFLPLKPSPGTAMVVSPSGLGKTQGFRDVCP
jgi:hypothetical protein